MHVTDSTRFALKSAALTGLVVQAAFALGLVVLDLPQTALIAAFGALAMLAFVDFGGPWRHRLRSYALLTAAGFVLIPIATLLSRFTVPAVIAMGVIGFLILYAGVLSESVAAAHYTTILVFVLAVMVPAHANEIPERLLGWGIAATLSTATVLLLFPRRPRELVRAKSARAARAMASLADATARGEDTSLLADAGLAAFRAAREDFLAMQHRPSGTSGRAAGLARLIDDLALLWRILQQPRASDEAAAPFAEHREAIERLVPGVLQATADRLVGSRDRTELDRLLPELERQHQELGDALVSHFEHLPSTEDEARATEELDEAYRLRMLSFATVEAAWQALASLGEAPDDHPWPWADMVANPPTSVVLAHATLRSVWLRDSLRGAIGLALAVLVANLAELQLAFWVVLGTLGVLRSNALATGATARRALLGNFAGILIGGVLVELLGNHEAVLWVLLPIATAVAAFAPRELSFAAGQAAFSVVVLILFNLIGPAGWQVGLVRIEDLLIGAAISLLVGLLLWPRGAAAVLRQSIGVAYTRAGAYLDATVGALLGEDRELDAAARDAFDAGQVMDATVREYLAERSSSQSGVADLGVLCTGARRMRSVAQLLEQTHAIGHLSPVDENLPRLTASAQELQADCAQRCAWYASLGAAIAEDKPLPRPEAERADNGAPMGVVLERAAGEDGAPAGLAIAWAHRHLLMLRAMEPGLVRASGELHD